ncbi:MAG: TonB-dependent receptor plug domain-containing protein [Tannerella sp.]|nr:TonB-dependent receptor plug domain-containing protein [Tannerella sp.]
MRNIVIFLVFVLCGLNVFGQVNRVGSIEEIQARIDSQLMIFPQEKIHLHLDRDCYVPGEKIWFKAYVTDMLTHQSPTYSSYVYVELINSSDSLVSRVMIPKGEDEMYHGNVFLSDVIPEGYYTIRAYTRYMENLGEDYFFKKNIWIGKLPAIREQGKVKKKKSSKDNYDVSFFPEGGNLPEGEFCRIAFKALNRNGSSEYISGEVVDKEGQHICSVETVHSGMGSFMFVPEQSKEYYLKCKNRSGNEKRFKLPLARSTYSITTACRNQKIFVSLRKSAGLPKDPLYLLVHCRGIVCYFDSWKWKNGWISFPGNEFPSGVLQIVLFDQDMNPLSERLVFNKNESQDQARLIFSTDKSSYQSREKITSGLSVSDDNGIPLTGHVSVAVTDDGDIAVDTLNTILSSLLLSSELRGYIESPGYYLQDDRKAEVALDHLMMVHGWRRYNIPDVIRGNLKYPEIGFEQTKEISGTVKSTILGRPVINGEILFFSSDGTFGQAETDSAGFFSFYGPGFPDSTNFFIQAKNRKGRENVELILNKEQFPVLKYAPHSLTSGFPEADNENTMDDFMEKAEQRAKYDEDIRTIHLKEVEVTARKIEKKDEARLRFWANSSSDVTIYRDQIERRHPSKVADVLYGVAGVQVFGDGNILIRGVGSIAGRRPLVLIDGVPVEWPEDMFSIYDSPLENVSVHDVESIDVFKGPSTAMFGIRGSGGVISITTKIGGSDDSSSERRFNYAFVSPLGYQKPVEFYSPEYDTPESKHLGNPDFRTTIFWKPDVLLSEDGKATFEFYSSDFPTTYSVVIEGLSTDGKIIRQVERISIE